MRNSLVCWLAVSKGETLAHLLGPPPRVGAVRAQQDRRAPGLDGRFSQAVCGERPVPTGYSGEDLQHGHNERSERFSREMIRGEYRMVGQTVGFTITEKHWLVAWPVVQAQPFSSCPLADAERR